MALTALMIALVGVFLRNANLADVWTVVRTAHPGLLAAGVTCLFGTYVLRAVRWRYFLPPNADVGVGPLFESAIVGFFGNAVLPLRAGEIIRPYALMKWSRVPFGQGLASILIERVFDILSLLCFFVLIVVSIPNPPEVVVLGAQALGTVVVAAGTFVVAAYAFSGPMIRVVEWCAGRFLPAALGPRVVALAVEFIEGLRALSSGSRVFAAAILSLLIWFINGIYYLSCFWAFGEYPPMNVGILTSVIIAFAVAAPSAPGFIGVFQAGCVVAISTIYRYPKVFALAYSLVSHISQTLIIVVLGLVILHRRGLMLRDFSQRTPTA